MLSLVCGGITILIHDPIELTKLDSNYRMPARSMVFRRNTSVSGAFLGGQADNFERKDADHGISLSDFSSTMLFFKNLGND
jgi:hypothetical protein